MVNQDRLIAEFFELVKIDSISGYEREIADLLALKLQKLGLSVYEDDAGKRAGTKAGNIIARLPGNVPEAPILMLSAHMDTVQPGTDIQPVNIDNTIYSSGETILGADDKAGIAAILEALRVINEQQPAHGDVVVVLTIWEEGGLVGSGNIEFDRIGAHMGIVLDSDGDPGNIVVKGPSQDRLTATVKGRAAHAGINPQDGINAIQVASRAVSKMSLGRIDEETTANVGVISGGKAINIVPDSTTVHGEARSMSPEKRAAQTESMCAALREAAAQAGATVDIRVETIYPDMNLAENEPVVKLVSSAAEELGLKPKLTSTGGGSDANFFNQYGLPTVNLGIGMKKVHTTEEYITVANLVKNAEFVAKIILKAAVLKSN
ncbi:MAG: M20/M25/M40 family metallo-hydrolase [Firmicutes bacterium]|nr:M20/M25/M40 family metallo-hydrolase [Bacillota bacterium]